MSVYATLSRFIRDSTAAGRALLTAATAGDQRTALGLGTAAQSASSDFAAAVHTHDDRYFTETEINSLLASYLTVSAAGTGYQPLDSDLTAIAALTTTTFGRSLLTQADAAAARSTIGAGTSSFDGAYSSLSGVPTTLSGYGITDALTAATAANTYLALAGGTLIGPVTGSGATVEFRDGTTAQTLEVAGTWTSSTNREALRIRAVLGGNYQISSIVGSGGGSNQAIDIGHTNSAGAFTAAISVATDSTTTFRGPLITAASTTTSAGLRIPVAVSAPSSSVTGDVYVSATGTSLHVYLNGAFRTIANLTTAQTWSSVQTFLTSGTGNPSIVIPHGSAPTSPVNGAIWTTTVGAFTQINSATQRVLTHAPAWNTYSPAGGATATILLDSAGSNLHRVTRPTSGNITIAFSGDTANQVFLLVLATAGSGTPGTVTWPAGLTWLTNAGSPPTISTAVSKVDSFVFLRTGASTYLAWHTGQN